MELSTYLVIYILGWTATGIAMVDRPTFIDIAAASVAALFWPVLIPAHFIRRLRG